jgi:hypothetical protein
MKSPWSRRFALVLGVAGLFAGASCALVTSYDCFDAPCTDASSTTDSSAPPTAACGVKRPPPKSPTAPNGQDGKRYAVVVNQASLDAKTTDPLGFDLDNACTCDGDKPSCTNPKALPGAPGTGSQCDRPGGVDNQASTLFSDAVIGLVLGENALRSAVAAGRFAPILQISDWNGTPDDSEIRVDFFSGVERRGGISSTDAGMDAGTNNGGRDASGEDASIEGGKTGELEGWTIHREGVVAEGGAFASLTNFGKGYVTQGRLVVESNSSYPILFRTQFGDKPTDIRTSQILLVAPTLVAEIRKTANGVTLTNGVIAARWSLQGALRLVAAQSDCKASPVYDSFRAQLCSAADIRLATSPLDPSAACDAISFTMAFGGSPVEVRALDGTNVTTCAELKDDCSR